MQTRWGFPTPNATAVQLAVEGISTLDDLSKFSKEDINNLADSLRRMRVPAIADGPPMEQQRFVMGARSQKCLAVAAQIVRYYEAVGQTLTAVNMRWETLSNFEIQWRAIHRQWAMMEGVPYTFIIHSSTEETRRDETRQDD